MSQQVTSVAVVSVALAAAVWAGYFLAGRTARAGKPVTEGQLVRRLRTADPGTPRYYYRESQHPGLSEAVYVSLRPLSEEELAGLAKHGYPGPQWEGVFWVAVEADQPGGFPRDAHYRRHGGFLFYGDETAVAEACRHAGLD